MKRDSLLQVSEDGVASEIAILSLEKRALFDLKQLRDCRRSVSMQWNWKLQSDIAFTLS